MASTRRGGWVVPTPPRARWGPLPVDGPKAPRSRLHPLDRMEHTEWMGTPRRGAHVPPPTGHSRWAWTSCPSAHRDGRHRELGPRHPESPSPSHVVLYVAGLRCRRGGSANRAPRFPLLGGRPSSDRGCPCRCRAPASSDPGPRAPAAFLLDPGPGQGETAGAPSCGQGVQARPVKGVARGHMKR